MILMFFSTLHCPSLSVDLLDARLFSETLSKLATDGLGVSALQVTSTVISFKKENAKIESLHLTLTKMRFKRNVIFYQLKCLFVFFYQGANLSTVFSKLFFFSILLWLSMSSFDFITECLFFTSRL